MSHTMIIADDHPLMRSGICTEIEKHREYKVIGEANNGQELLELLKQRLPEVILLDVRMPGMRATTLVSKIQLRCPHCKIIILSAYDDAGIVKSLIDQGVDAYILKDEIQDVVIEALRTVLEEGGRWMSEKIRERYNSASAEAVGTDLISKREWPVIELLCEGLSNQDIAAELNIAKSTVSYHVSNILEKLKLNSRVEIVLWAKEHLDRQQ
ncbi:MAG: response regulator transcription factor [Anaerolineae bacterium]|nr:response regulator transcription factor [Anaerolineae bacterium]